MIGWYKRSRSRLGANWAESTSQKYLYGWKAWEKWAERYKEVTAIPADPFHICLYLNDLIQEKKKPGALTNALTGIRWEHLSYLSPTEDYLVELT